MYDLKLFVITFMEISCFMILWSAFNKSIISKYKNLIIIILCSAFSMLLNGFDFYFGVLNYTFILIAIYFFYKKNFGELLLEFSICTFIMMITQILFTNLFYIILDENFDYLKFGFIITMLDIIIFILIYLYAPITKYYDKYKNYIGAGIFCVINPIICIFFMKVLWDYNKDIILKNTFIFFILFLIFNITNFSFYKYILKLKEKQRKEEFYNPLMQDMMDEIRRKQHDFKNHLNTIYGIVQVNDEKNLKEELNKYINSLNQSLRDVDCMIQIKDKVLAAIIYSKIVQAEKLGVIFNYSIKSHLEKYPFRDYEFSEIIGNLLDNAFDALRERDFKYKEVCLKIDCCQDRNYIEIKNTGVTIKPEYIDKIFKKGFSTKGQDNRGYGLYNVKKIVEYYGGKILLSFENEYTSFKILF